MRIGLFSCDLPRSASAAAALAVIGCCALAGCGYEHKELFPQNVHTVAVPIFKNRNPQLYRNIEFDLTEALAKEIELRTPYKVVDVASADTVLEGTITSVAQRQLSVRRAGGLPLEMQTHVMVDFEWKNIRDGQTLRQRKGFEAVGRYTPARPVSQPFEVSQHAAVEVMARDIVSVMRDQW